MQTEVHIYTLGNALTITHEDFALSKHTGPFTVARLTSGPTTAKIFLAYGQRLSLCESLPSPSPLPTNEEAQP